MAEEVNMSKVINEVKNANENEDELRKVIEGWYERTRTAGLKIGARLISAGIYGVIRKHILKKEKASLRDYKRMTDEIIEIISVQLVNQNESETNKTAEDISNDE